MPGAHWRDPGNLLISLCLLFSASALSATLRAAPERNRSYRQTHPF